MFWYAIRVFPQKEFRARDMLREEGREVFLPVERRWATSRRRIVYERTLPLLGTYLFVRCLPWQLSVLFKGRDYFRWWKVGTAGVPRPVAEHAIDIMRAASDKPLPERWKPQPGELVRVIKGALEGEAVMVTELLGRRGKRLMVECRGRACMVYADTVEPFP